MSRSTRIWIWLLLLVLVGIGLIRLRLDVEVLNLLPSTLSAVQGLRTYQEEFAHGQDLIVTLESPSAERTRTTAQQLAALLRQHADLVRRVVWQPPFVERPDQAAEMLAYLWYNSSGFSELTNRLSGGGLTNALQSAKAELATTLSPRQLAWGGYDPFGLTEPPRGPGAGRFDVSEAERLFSSEDGTFRVVFVEPEPDVTPYRDCNRWLEEIEAVVIRAQASGEPPADVTIAFTGRPAFVREIAGGMERDMINSVTGTLVVITALFYLWHRRWRPLLWLLALLALVLATTLALGGLIFRELNVVSTGFAAILLGLAADYALVLYQEAADAPETTLNQIRQQVGGGILWSAVTTALAFLMLQFSQLPGLAQLGALVAIGVVVAALLMLRAFLPPLWPISQGQRSRRLVVPNPIAWASTILLLGLGILLLWKDRPKFDHTANALKPRQSEAYAAVEKIKRKLARPEEPLWVVISGPEVEAVAEHLKEVERVLSRAESNGWVESFTLPGELWPHASQQRANRQAAQWLVGQTNKLSATAQAQGFTPAALRLCLEMIQVWDQATHQDPFWPSNSASRWVLNSVAAQSATGPIALALVHVPGHPGYREEALDHLVQHWPEGLAKGGVILTGWELVGRQIFGLVSADLPKVLIPMTLFVVAALSLAFRSLREVVLSLATLAVGGLALWVVMDLAGWSWNLMNMMALPLLLGAGVDYSIHIQLAMRRHHGDANKARSTTGWALLLCAATTFSAFGSLGFSSNAGLASLGQVCAAGIACAWVVAVGLLPTWWLAVSPKGGKPA